MEKEGQQEGMGGGGSDDPQGSLEETQSTFCSPLVLILNPFVSP